MDYTFRVASVSLIYLPVLLHLCLGFLPPLNSPLYEKLSAIIVNAISVFTNLRTSILTPATFEGIFTGILKQLTERSDKRIDNGSHVPSTPPPLRELVVNPSCTDAVRAPILYQLTGLSKLTILSPTRAVLELLPDWLRRLSDTLTELHLRVSYFPTSLFLFPDLVLPFVAITSLFDSPSPLFPMCSSWSTDRRSSLFLRVGDLTVPSHPITLRSTPNFYFR